MRLSIGAVFLLLGCEATITENSPPVVSEPVAGFTTDRALVRVHMSAPGDGASSGQSTSYGGGHANWRINGGATTEVSRPINDRDPIHPFVFSAIVPEGSSSLELGRCNDVDQCGYTKVNVVLKTASGSPDPSFGGAGQLIEPRLGRAEGVAVLPDGRVLIAAEGNESPPKMGLIMFKPDGHKDLTWGTNGVASLTVVNARAFLLPRPGGGVLAIFSRPSAGQTYVARFDAAGKLDTAFADPALGGEVRGFPWQGPSGGVILDAVVDGAGHVVVAGQAQASDLGSAPPFIQTVDFDLNSLAVMELATGAPVAANVVAASLDKTGRAAFLLDDRLTRGSTAGVETTFGTAGRVDLPSNFSSTGAVALRADGTVVSVRKTASSLHVSWVTATGVVSSFEVPSDGPPPAMGDWPMVLKESAAGVYLASTGLRPSDATRAWTMENEPGSDIVVFRLNAGAIDTTFGTAGRADASMALSWAPVSTESLLDTPLAMAIDPAGKPVVVGGSATTTQATLDSYTKRGPGMAAVKFIP